MERLDVGIGVFLAALIRDFWVVERLGFATPGNTASG
jgi:hypothetical protein